MSSTCAHTSVDWENCQRCGRPHCTKCVTKEYASDGGKCVLPRCGVTIAFDVCRECRVVLKQLDNTIPEKPNVNVRCGQHGSGPGSEFATCKECSQVAILDKQLRTESVLAVLAATKWYGRGGTRTNAGKAAFAAAVSVPMLAVNAVTGVLGGFASGALAGAGFGFISAGAMGYDAGNSFGATKKKDVKASAPPSSGAGAPGGGASDASGSSSGGGGGTAASAGGPLEEKLKGMMTKAKAIMRMSPEEQEADAKAEAARIVACKTAYEVLEVPASASKEELSKAHKAKSMAYHPDKNSAEAAKGVAQACNNAYALLSDPEKRAKYDNSDFKDTSGVDLSEGVNIDIKTTRGGAVMGGVAGTLGGIAGLGLGAAAGVLTGALGAVGSTAAGAYRMSQDVLHARVVIAERVAARRASLTKKGVKAGLGTVLAASGSTGPTVRLDAAEHAVRVSLPSSALPVLPSIASAPSPSLYIAPFTTPELHVDLELSIGPRFMERFSRTAGSEDGDRLFARKFALSVGEVCKAERKKLGITEPKTETGIEDEGGNGSGGGHAGEQGGDATGMHGGDTYEDRVAANSTTISSAGGLISHAFTEIGKEVDGHRAMEEYQNWAVLAARYEAWSRGMDAAEMWLAGRLKGILGKADEEEEGQAGQGQDGSSGSTGAAEGKAAEGAKAAAGAKKEKEKKLKIKSILDPDSCCPSASEAAGTDKAVQEEVRWAKASRELGLGPFLVTEVAVVLQGEAAAAAGKTSKAVAAGSQDAGCSPWRVLAVTPVSAVSAASQEQARAGQGSEIQLLQGSLPAALLTDAGPVGASGDVKLRFRTYISSSDSRLSPVLACAGLAGSVWPVGPAYGVRTTDVTLPRDMLATVATKA